VDRLLGFNTVPPGRLIAFNAQDWVEWFSDSMCGPEKELSQKLRALSNSLRKFDRSTPVVVGWLQLKVDPLRVNSKPMRELHCGVDQPNGTAVGGGPDFISSYVSQPSRNLSAGVLYTVGAALIMVLVGS
jgi:hypothetical protein